MTRADRLLSSTIRTIDLDVSTMTMHVVTELLELSGRTTHLLSLIGISRAEIHNAEALPMTYAELSDFKFTALPDGTMQLGLDVWSPRTRMEVWCEFAVFDGERVEAGSG